MVVYIGNMSFSSDNHEDEIVFSWATGKDDLCHEISQRNAFNYSIHPDSYQSPDPADL
jgi:hypothetical protein